MSAQKLISLKDEMGRNNYRAQTLTLDPNQESEKKIVPTLAPPF